MVISEYFREAVRDYFFLISNHYPVKQVKKIVGDRYMLSGTERSILYRGVFTKDIAEARKKKRLTSEKLVGQTVHLDGFNVLITMISYLNGNPVFIARDGFVRDASETHGKRISEDLLIKSLDMCCEVLSTIRIIYANFYYDTQLNHNQRLIEHTKKSLIKNKIEGDTGTFDNVDTLLQNIAEGIIVTSDSEIIDRSLVPVFDLPFEIISNSFNKELLDIGKMVV